MLKIIKIAYKNLFRNKKRFIITVISIFFGVFVSTMFNGMVKATQKALEEVLTRSQTGDFQLCTKQQSESLDFLSLEYTISDTSKIIDILKNEKNVHSFTQRLKFTGMLSYGSNDATFIASACDPLTIFNVCPNLKDIIKQGEFIDGDNQVVISEILAKQMNINIDDNVLLLARTKNGAMGSMYAEVKGISASMIMGDKNMIYIDLQSARKLLELGNESSEIAVRINKSEELSQFAEQMRSKYKENKIDVSLKTWSEIVPFFKTVMGIQNVFVIVISFILFILITSTIINTILIGVYERLKEIGTMKAIGIRSKQILRLFLVEGLLYGLSGGIVATLISQIIMWVIKLNGGLIYSFPMRFGAAKPWIITPKVSIEFVAIMILYACVSGMIASLYPALKASNMKITDILRKNILYR